MRTTPWSQTAAIVRACPIRKRSADYCKVRELSLIARLLIISFLSPNKKQATFLPQRVRRSKPVSRPGELADGSCPRHAPLHFIPWKMLVNVRQRFIKRYKPEWSTRKGDQIDIPWMNRVSMVLVSRGP